MSTTRKHTSGQGTDPHCAIALPKWYQPLPWCEETLPHTAKMNPRTTTEPHPMLPSENSPSQCEQRETYLPVRSPGHVGQTPSQCEQRETYTTIAINWASLPMLTADTEHQIPIHSSWMLATTEPKKGREGFILSTIPPVGGATSPDKNSRAPSETKSAPSRF